MKKVFCVIMMVVMLMTVGSFAEGNVKNGDPSEVCGWTVEWLAQNGMYEDYNQVFRNGCYYVYGVLNGAELGRIYGVDEWSEDTISSLYLSDECPYEVTEVSIDVIGSYNGFNIYLMKIGSNTPLGTTFDGIDYYQGEIVFMICE